MPKVSEVMRMLKKMGCKCDKQGKNHEWWINPKNGKRFQIPRHKSKEINPDTLDDILREADLKKK